MEKNKDQIISELLREQKAHKKTIEVLMKRVEETLSIENNAFSEFGNSVLLAKKKEERTNELKEATKELEEASKYNLAIIHSLADNLIVVDAKGRIQDLNKKSVQTLKKPRKDLIGKSIESIIKINMNRNMPPKSLERLLNEVKDKGIIKSQEVQLIDSKNNTVNCLLTGSVLKGAVDEVKSIIFLLRDITELKAMEKIVESEKLRSMNSARLASLGEMAGGIAHEINNPLAIISGTLVLMKRVLAKQKDVDEKIITSIDKIDSTVNRIVRIVQGLRNITRADGKFEISCVKLNDLFEDILGLCGEKFRNQQVDLICEFEEEGIEIFCERVQFSQVLLNILGNAFDAVLSSPGSEKWIKVNTLSKNSKFIIRITNSGEKISRKIVDKIFDPFFTSKEPGKGTGLGLSISKSIIEKHQGDLFLDLNNENTCFEIQIPLQMANIKT